MLDLIQQLHLGDDPSWRWKGLIGCYNLGLPITWGLGLRRDWWIGNKGLGGCLISDTTSLDPGPICGEGPREVAYIIREDPWGVGSLPPFDIHL